ncbi:heterogeneous nuclear ribonucleoprotein 1-like [Durio zibethinus]|uniref:Heterogeneous nuclear ribonucleoprotein 1-like n=1 Tax=Durio zibethinus TaxID=66656 RepID=A0A6P6BAJ2_DURZI|nr:heterogeneous nuclear ribonucleoprotein 1-like [Durio zibethinus]
MEFQNPKLFVGGVSNEIDEATLRQHFSQYGEVEHAFIIHGKGIGFVTFTDPLMAKNALQEEHIILGTKVDVKPAKPRVEISNRKIFVGGLPSTITLEEFKEYFGSYGAITDAAIIYDKGSHKFRGFGFVTYDSEEAAEKVLQKNFHELNNKMVEVKRAEPKEKTKKNIEYHDVGTPAALPVPCGLYDVTAQPGFIPHGGSCRCHRCYYYNYYHDYYYCFFVLVPDEYQHSFGSYLSKWPH